MRPLTVEASSIEVGYPGVYDYGQGSLNLNAAYNHIFRAFESDFPNSFDGESLVFDLFHKYQWGDSWYTVVGFNHVAGETTYDHKRRTTNNDPYLNMVYVGDRGWNVNTGLRVNNHNTYGTHIVYHVNPSYRWKSEQGYLKVYGSYASSFIAPSLTQLYGPFGANPELEPEENVTIELGTQWKANDRWSSGITLFTREENQFIDYVVINPETFEGRYQNVEEAFTVRGVEAELMVQPTSYLSLSANYSFTESPDRQSLRLPKHRANADLGFTLNPATFASLRMTYVGERLDTDFTTFTSVDLSSYTLIDFYVSRQVLQEKIKVFLGINNVLNEDYTEIVGFTTQGRNVRLGFSVNL
ncbi:TonB-dependent receptor plug domain-containing protein [Croceiramulus getboli]|nr:TonB-dependent receptor [Flavobacteriaceae bacterium YJPT1-3]